MTHSGKFELIGTTADRLISNLIEFRKFSEMLNRSSIVSERSINRVGERPKVENPIILHQAGKIFFASGAIDALKPREGGACLSVRIILPASGQPKIGNGVIVPAPINVIYKIAWPRTVTIEPRQPRSLVEKIINSDDPISIVPVDAASDLSDEVTAYIVIFPNKLTALLIVFEKIMEPLDRQRTGASFVRHSLSSEKQKNEKTAGNDNGEKAGKEQPGADREYIESRLRELSAFERRARGEAIRKRKM